MLELWKYRELLFALSIREIKIRYKQTVFGILWAIIQPLSLMIVFTFVFSYFLKIDTGHVPYPIFAYSALLPWTFFSTSLYFGSLSVITNSSLITKVYFPREILPFSSLGVAILDLAVASFLFMGMVLVYNTPITFNLIFIPVILLVEIAFTAAILLIFSTLIVIWRDLKFVIPLITQLWFFATPVIYPLAKIPEKYRFIYMINPISIIVDDFRAVSVYGTQPNWYGLIIAGSISLFIFVAGYIFFKANEKRFADIV